jgi:hypothetical protein
MAWHSVVSAFHTAGPRTHHLAERQGRILDGTTTARHMGTGQPAPPLRESTTATRRTTTNEHEPHDPHH